MVTFCAKRFLLIQFDGLRLRLYRSGNSILPFHPMWVQQKLVIGGVIKHRHLFRAHDDELLFLNGVQPAYKDVSLYTARKIEVT